MNRILRKIMLVSFCLVLSGNAAAIVVTAGIDDNFTAPTEPTAPSADLLPLLPGSAHFDQLTQDQIVAHTFTGLTNVVSATLELRVQATQVPGVDTDGIFISFADAGTPTLGDAIAWSRTFGVFAGGGIFPDPDNGLASPGVNWGFGTVADLTLDLAALPLALGGTINILGLINSHGFLDVGVGDETVVDYMRLTYQTRGGNNNVPEPATLALMGLGLAGLGFTRRKKA